MMTRRWILAGAACAGIGATALTGLAQDWGRGADRDRGGNERERGDREIDRYLAELRAAATPSEVVEAYTRAKQNVNRELAIERAYVRRMAELGLPEMAYDQANRVAARHPRDGVSRAVLAYMSARLGRDADAVREISAAADLQMHDEFTLRTGGQIVAWLDVGADQAQIPPETLAQADVLWRQMKHHPEFVESYRRARRAYLDQRDDRRHGALPGQPSNTLTAALPVRSDPYACAGGPCEPWQPEPWYRLTHFGPRISLDGPRPHERVRADVQPK